jgi:hypothetical protein
MESNDQNQVLLHKNDYFLMDLPKRTFETRQIGPALTPNA